MSSAAPSEDSHQLTPDERARASLFETMAGSSWPSPWRRVRAQGVTAGYTTQIDGQPLAAAYLRTDVVAKPDDVCALIFDSRGTGLAGQLLCWESTWLDDHRQRLHYEVELPPPFRPRSFWIVQHRAAEGPVHWLFSHDDADATKQAKPGHVPAHLQRSDYRLTELDRGALRFERIIALDLRLPVPRSWFARTLGREQVADAARLNMALARRAVTRRE